MQSEAKGKLPKGTDTESWREMSARAAWMFWLTFRREKIKSTSEEELAAWQTEAADYRVYIRAVLRQLKKEGISVDYATRGAALSADDWAQKSARVAWLLWLTAHRNNNPANEALEAKYWNREAPEYRKVVRHALKALEAENIVLS